MADEPKTEKKSKNPLVYVGIGCLVLVVLLGVGSALIAKFVAGKIGSGMVQNAIESKTGVKANIEDLEKGKMTFTDSKTGATVNIGTNEVPEAFPKDFPLYPGVKVTSSLSGAQAGKSNGFWLTLTTPDAPEKVLAFYKTELAKNGWTTEATVTANDMTNESVEKGTMKGSISVGKTSGETDTQIVIILGEDD